MTCLTCRGPASLVVQSARQVALIFKLGPAAGEQCLQAGQVRHVASDCGKLLLIAKCLWQVPVLHYVLALTRGAGTGLFRCQSLVSSGSLARWLAPPSKQQQAQTTRWSFRFGISVWSEMKCPLVWTALQRLGQWPDPLSSMPDQLVVCQRVFYSICMSRHPPPPFFIRVTHYLPELLAGSQPFALDAQRAGRGHSTRRPAWHP